MLIEIEERGRQEGLMGREERGGDKIYLIEWI